MEYQNKIRSRLITIQQRVFIMDNDITGMDLQEQLSRLGRLGSRVMKDQLDLVTATGTMPPAWVIRVVSLDSYNYYNVKLVEITAPGNPPSSITENIKAYNVAESFDTGSGSVSTGTYAVMWRAGNCNVFYVAQGA